MCLGLVCCVPQEWELAAACFALHRCACRDHVSFSGSCPVEVCLCVLACRRWGAGSKQGSMKYLGHSLFLGIIERSSV